MPRPTRPLSLVGAAVSLLALAACPSPTRPVPTPVALEATAGDGRVSLQWTASTSAVVYRVKRATVRGGPHSLISSTESTSHADADLVNGTPYHYVVTALNSAGESADSNEVSATPMAAVIAPDVPTGLAAIGGDSVVSLTWRAAQRADRYHVQRATTAGGPYAEIATSSGPTFNDTGLTNGTAYFYVVSASNPAGASADSNEASATPTAALTAPEAPTGLAAVGGDAVISLSWMAARGAALYHVQRATTAGGPYTEIASSAGLTYGDTGLINGTVYFYVVSASNSAGEGAGSNEVSATPAAAVVPATGVVINEGVASIALGATAALTATVSPATATDKTVTWASSDPSVVGVASTVDGTALLTGLAVGSSTITARDVANHTATRVISVVASSLALSLVASRDHGPAPLAVHFDATGTTSPRTDKPFRDLLYRWSFGDGSSGTWNTGARPGALSRNAATGPIAGHVFETAGSHIVTLTVFDGATTVSTTKTITVDDPDAYYAGSKTLYVSSSALPAAGVDGVPAGAQCFLETTLDAAMAHITANDQRLLLKRGDTFLINDQSRRRFSGITVGAYGSGPKPQLTFNTPGTNWGAITCENPDWRLMDLSFRTIATPGTRFSQTAVAGQNVDDVLLLRVDTRIVSQIFSGGSGRTFVVDCDLRETHGGYGNTGIWADGGTVVILGSAFVDCRNIEHNVRTQGSNKSVYSSNELSVQANYKHLLAIRGDQRNVGSPASDYGYITEQIVVSDNLFDQGPYNDGGLMVQVAPQADSHKEPIEDVLFERNFVRYRKGSWAGVCQFMVQSGLTIRNNLFLLEGTSLSGLSLAPRNRSMPAAVLSDAAIDNNSFFSPAGMFNAISLWSETGTDVSGVKIRNNLVHAPNATTDGYNSGQSTMLVVWKQGEMASGTQYTEEHNSTAIQARQTAPGWVAQPPTAIADFHLTSTSYALGGGVALPVFEDFFGVSRTGPVEMGAVTEP